VPGLYLIANSNQKLHVLGRGANAFRLTRRLVLQDVYRYLRNPMSLGYYLLSIGTGFMSGSSFLTLFALLGVIPTHLFFLRYFEEKELELRFGSAYLEYKRRVPFLIPGRGRQA
jgi:protein-S-isoprenylcysteine O-methyltransferase Ste14